jgi:hypothetical protein
MTWGPMFMVGGNFDRFGLESFAEHVPSSSHSEERPPPGAVERPTLWPIVRQWRPQGLDR